MKAVAFCGSARKKGNTYQLLSTVLDELERQGLETELVELAGQPVKGCVACYGCFESMDKKCRVTDDCLNDCLAKMDEADVILLGSPTYFADISPEMKALIDRCGMVGRANGDMFKRKIGAGVIAVRRAGAIHALDSLNHFFLIAQMIVVGSSYWNIGIGREKGDVVEDDEGMQTMKILGENIGWLVRQIHNK